MAENKIGQKWSKEDDEKLISMLKDRKTFSEIADACGRNKGGIRGRIRSICADLFNSGKTIQEVAEHMGLEDNFVQQKIRFESTKKSKKKWTDEETKMLIGMMDDGKNIDVISKKIEKSKRSVIYKMLYERRNNDNKEVVNKYLDDNDEEIRKIGTVGFTDPNTYIFCKDMKKSIGKIKEMIEVLTKDMMLIKTKMGIDN